MADADQVRFGYAGGMNAVMALDQYLAQTSGKRRPLDGVLRTLGFVPPTGALWTCPRGSWY